MSDAEKLRRISYYLNPKEKACGVGAVDLLAIADRHEKMQAALEKGISVLKAPDWLLDLMREALK